MTRLERGQGGEVKNHSTTRFFAALQNDRRENEMLRPDKSGLQHDPPTPRLPPTLKLPAGESVGKQEEKRGMDSRLHGNDPSTSLRVS
jgi:hypothetical protein